MVHRAPAAAYIPIKGLTHARPGRRATRSAHRPGPGSSADQAGLSAFRRIQPMPSSAQSHVTET